MKEAIQKAIEGGWKYKNSRGEYKVDVFSNEMTGAFSILVTSKDGYQKYIHFSEICLDPLFWQCLGKALGWKEIICRNETPNAPECRCDGGGQAGWFYNWHRFIDWIAEGKDVDEFFKELLKDK